MVTVFDVAKYILDQEGRMTTMKLQKLVYYSHAWSLVWDEKPLFREQVRAWANGPVVQELYVAHKGMYEIDSKSLTRGNPEALRRRERETVKAVLKHYGKKSAQYLIDLTHREPPWREARGSLPPESTQSPPINNADIAEYYSSLTK